MDFPLAITILQNPTLQVALATGVITAWSALMALLGSGFMSWRQSKTQLASSRMQADVSLSATAAQVETAKVTVDTQFSTAFLANMRGLAELWQQQVEDRDQELLQVHAELDNLRAASAAQQADLILLRAQLADCLRKQGAGPLDPTD